MLTRLNTENLLKFILKLLIPGKLYIIIMVHGLIEATRGVQTNVWKSSNFLGKTAKHSCLPEIQITMIHKCMSALETAAHLQDRSMSSPRGWADQQDWGTECQAVIPCGWDHWHTTGLPCSVQELRGHDRAAGLHLWSWRWGQGTWELGPWPANSESCSCYQPSPSAHETGLEHSVASTTQASAGSLLKT